MLGLFRKSSQSSKKHQRLEEENWFSVNFSPENFIPGIIIGFLFGFFLDLTKLPRNNGNRSSKLITSSNISKHKQQRIGANGNDEELKMVLVVRQDLKMGAGKIASQCAHAATGIYSEMMQRKFKSLLEMTVRVAEVLIAKSAVSFETMGTMWPTQNCCLMQKPTRNVSRNKLKGAAESIGLPTFVVADAGRTQVLAGSKTVLAVGPDCIVLNELVNGNTLNLTFYYWFKNISSNASLDNYCPNCYR
ncbi:hypothetical protein GIB67_010150 [Kingdonia uniflora]|uniref:peptidyl-tRNA hydrolase n=1 Tax=Kingdonia uniflora TaxID=39325 RepID=A0A7J7NAY0_9MAGN|nr:hypothetical protein GIB67_010150 [Kingdonia uniflora]